MISLGFIYTKNQQTLAARTQAKDIQTFALKICIIKSFRQSKSHTIPRMLFLPLIYICILKIVRVKTFWENILIVKFKL
jgi:hypothetical protein